MIYDTAADIRRVCSQISTMLVSKNASYGDSALSPTRIFSRADAIEAIKVRIDDKLSRLMRGNGEDFHEDTIDDLMGYLVLLKIARERKTAEGYAKAAMADALNASGVADEQIGRTVPLRTPSEGPSLETTREDCGNVDPMDHHDI